MKFDIEKFMEHVNLTSPHEPEFTQSVYEVADSLKDFLNENPKYLKHKIMERISEPERTISFKVTWEDDNGEVHVNKGYRVQFNSAIGPYKGGLRFHPSVNLSILKFLGFEQIFKNSLTGIPMGGGKGGSNFDPSGKSDAEVMRFAQAFMNELYRHIGANTDVPAGDIGVGAREIGYLYGQYKKLRNEFTGVLTGKGLDWGGSNIRTEATGYGLVYFLKEMLNTKSESMQNKKVLISGSGNVAQYAAEKVIQEGGKVITMSDSDGTIVDHDGISQERLEFIKELKNQRRGRIKEYAEKFDVDYLEEKRPWSVKADIALPCATQNELYENDAKELIENGVIAIGEGANMPTTIEAIEEIRKAKILFSPGKASNAGGVATSGLEMSQNSLRMSWTREEVDINLRKIMKKIHDTTMQHGQKGDYIDYVDGANIAGFQKVADSMIAQGLV